jgi:hypothetical protein
LFFRQVPTLNMIFINASILLVILNCYKTEQITLKGNLQIAVNWSIK